MRVLTAFFMAASLFLYSCNDDDGPADLISVTSRTNPGEIILEWEAPLDGSIYYVNVEYLDYRTKVQESKMYPVGGPAYILNTRARYPEYEFHVTPVDSDDKRGHTVVVKQKSEPAKADTYFIETQVKLNENDLSTNAQEESEGPIKNLLDDDTNSFFHTRWRDPVPPAPHWLGVDLKREINKIRFSYWPRNNANNKPTDFDLLGSVDGNEWFLIKNYTQEADGLPITNSDPFESPWVETPADKPFRYIRISVNKTNNDTVFFTMSEFKVWTGEDKYLDPEKDEEEVE